VAAPLPREVQKGGIVVDGHYVPEGCVIGVPAYVVHHNREAFPDPWAYRPERWIVGSSFPGLGHGIVSEEDVSRARQSMCPFSLGHRGCIGKKLAYMELRIALAMLLWSYDLEEFEDEREQIGGGSPRLGEGRQRVDEFQLFDCFGADRDGPIVKFRARGPFYVNLVSGDVA
jgi:cytochrome P450